MNWSDAKKCGLAVTLLWKYEWQGCLWTRLRQKPAPDIVFELSISKSICNWYLGVHTSGGKSGEMWEERDRTNLGFRFFSWLSRLQKKILEYFLGQLRFFLLQPDIEVKEENSRKIAASANYKVSNQSVGDCIPKCEPEVVDADHRGQQILLLTAADENNIIFS